MQKKITALQAEHKKYEDRLEALDATAAGVDKKNVEREKAYLRERIISTNNCIMSCEHEIICVREAVARSVWS